MKTGDVVYDRPKLYENKYDVVLYPYENNIDVFIQRLVGYSADKSLYNLPSVVFSSKNKDESDEFFNNISKHTSTVLMVNNMVGFDYRFHKGYAVLLKENSSNLLSALENIFGYSYEDSNTLVESIPCLVKADITEKELDNFKKQLDELNVNYDILTNGVKPRKGIFGIVLLDFDKDNYSHYSYVNSHFDYEHCYKDYDADEPIIITGGLSKDEALYELVKLREEGMTAELVQNVDDSYPRGKHRLDVYTPGNDPIELSKELSKIFNVSYSEIAELLSKTPCTICDYLPGNKSTQLYLIFDKYKAMHSFTSVTPYYDFLVNHKPGFELLLMHPGIDDDSYEYINRLHPDIKYETYPSIIYHSDKKEDVVEIYNKLIEYGAKVRIIGDIKGNSKESLKDIYVTKKSILEKHHEVIAKYLGISIEKSKELYNKPPFLLTEGVGAKFANDIKHALSLTLTESMIIPNRKVKGKFVIAGDAIKIMINSYSTDKIKAITTVKNIFKLGLVDSKRIIENVPYEMPDLYSVTEANSIVEALAKENVMASIMNDVEEVVQQLDYYYSVKLKSIGNNKINIIKIVMDINKIGLIDAKKLVEIPDVLIVEDVERERAYEAYNKLFAGGAKLELIRRTIFDSEVVEVENEEMVQEVSESNNGLVTVELNSFDRSYIVSIVKVVKNALNLGLKEAKDLVESAPVVLFKDVNYEDVESIINELTNYGCKVNIIRDGDTETKVITLPLIKLMSLGNRKLDVIKIVRDFLGMTLVEAKNLVESAPCILCDDKKMEECEHFIKQLTSVGAVLEVTDISNTQSDNENNLPAVSITDSYVTIKLAKCGSSKIETIKIVKEALGLGLKDAKDLVDSAPCVLSENFDMLEAQELKKRLEAIGCVVVIEGIDQDININETTPVQTTAVSSYNVVLKSAGDSKITVAKVMRDILDMGLTQAKDLVDETPCTILQNVDYDKALEVKKELEDYGATIDIVSGGSTETKSKNSNLLDVKLVNAGDSKITVAKVMRDVLDMGLSEAKELVEKAPCIIATGLNKKQAEEIKKELEDYGAKIELV